MMKQLIDVDHWKRKEEYLFFKNFQSPLVGVTVAVDCSVAYRKAKEAGVSLAMYYLHAALVAVNRVEEFRYREEDGKVYLYDRVDLFTPILSVEKNYRSVALHYEEDFQKFLERAVPVVDEAKSGKGQAQGDGGRKDLVLISVNPWYRFTGIQLSDPVSPHENIPIFTFGKITPENGKQMMPVALRVNHGFVDGYHIGCFLNEFQQMLDR